MLAGRDFTDADIATQRNVAVIDRRIADTLWPDGAIGRQIAYERGRGFLNLEIVGVSEAVRSTKVREEPLPHLFVPYHLWPATPSLVILR